MIVIYLFFYCHIKYISIGQVNIVMQKYNIHLQNGMYSNIEELEYSLELFTLYFRIIQIDTRNLIRTMDNYVSIFNYFSSTCLDTVTPV